VSALTALAVQNIDVLQALQAGGHTTLSALAEAVGRDKSNLSKTLKALEAGGLVVAAAGLPILADPGAAAIAAWGRANGEGDEGAAAGDAPYRLLRHDEIVPDPANARQDFDEGELAELAESMFALGMKQKPCVRPEPTPDGRYVLTMGERRWRAWGLLIASRRWSVSREEPCWLDEATGDAERAEGSLVENLQRSDLNHAEIAEGFEALATKHGRSNREIADRCGKTIEFVQQHRRLTRLPENDLERVRRKELPLHDALKLLAEPKAGAEPEAHKPMPLAAPLRLALVELAWKASDSPIHHDAAGGAWAHIDGSGYLSASWRAFRESGLVEEAMPRLFGRPCCIAKPTEAGLAWIRQSYPGGLTAAAVAGLRAEVGRLDREPGAGQDEGFFTDTLNGAIGLQNLTYAREAWEDPHPLWVLTLAEIANKVAHRPDATREGSKWIALPSDAENDSALHRLFFASLIRRTHHAGRSLCCVSEEGRALLERRLGGDPATQRTPLLKACSAAGLDGPAVDAGYNAGRYVITWLNGKAAPPPAVDRPAAPARAAVSAGGELRAPVTVFSLAIGDLVSIGGAASAYRILEPLNEREVDGVIRPSFRAQQVSLKTGRDYGKPRTITLAAIVGLISADAEDRDDAEDDDVELTPALRRLAGAAPADADA
jgi:ParB/RepB/Spo0J family partition protein